MHESHDAIAAIVNIENALLQLEIFSAKGKIAIPLIDQILEGISDGGIDIRDQWRYDFFLNLKQHLTKIHR